MGKRGQNEGTIRKRKDGRWEGRYIKERSADGKARYAYVYGKSYADAKQKLLDRRKELKLSVSVTTRAPRPGEIEGVNYFFRSEEQFQDMIARDEFLEYMCVFGKNHYGTPKAYVAEQRARGADRPPLPSDGRAPRGGTARAKPRAAT